VQGAGHGGVVTSVDIQAIWLSEKIWAEVIFIAWVFVLVIMEFYEFGALYNDPERLMREQLIEQRYALRVRILRHAANHGVASYRPHAVARKLTKRLFDKYKDESEDMPTTHHIAAMNKIGLAMTKVHNAWLNMQQIGYKRGYVLKEQTNAAVQRQASLAIIEIMDKVRAIHSANLAISELRRVANPTESSLSLKAMGKWSPGQFRLRFPIALKFFFRDSWNWVDGLNYVLFLVSFGIRIHTLDLIPAINLVSPIKDQLEKIRQEAEVLHDPNDIQTVRYGRYINFTALGYWYSILFNIYAFNAVSTV
jgi:hypothetical protein